MNQAATFLMKNGTLNLVRLGRLRLRVRLSQGSALIGGARKKGGSYKRRQRIVRKGSVAVSFTKSSRLKKLARMHIEEMTMEKYGVQEGADSEQLEKAASDGCPDCGGKVVRHGNVMKCESCGTAPFEKEKKKT